MTSKNLQSVLFIAFGGTGDLAWRKIIPALFYLRKQKRLTQKMVLLSVGRRTQFDDEKYRSNVRQALLDAGISKEDTNHWCDQCLHYQPLGDQKDEDYRRLAHRIEEIEKEHELEGNRVFYLALPPKSFISTIESLGRAGLHECPGWLRVVVEKPFGHDLESARTLNKKLHEYYSESQIYRIDHYLGKETVQNLLVFRFANSIFESQWNREHIERINITVAEDVGVEKRPEFFDRTGTLRDMVQNHIMQLLCLLAMEVPAAFESDAIHYEKAKVLRSLSPLDLQKVILGQYTQGYVGDQSLQAYRNHDGIPEDSTTETFAALELTINSWRWQGVPFSIRTGKRLPRRLTQIKVVFRRPPVCLFESMGSCLIHSNTLLITLQPDEGFTLLFDVKAPGEPLSLARLPLRFQYKEAFGKLPEAYETLILDVLRGDQTLFVHAGEVEESWRYFSSLLDNPPKVHLYPAGTWGPEAADRIAPRPRTQSQASPAEES